MQNLSKTEMLAALTNHITKVMTHFGDSCYAWDVVNEALNEDGSYRQSFWYTKTGTDYITTAFKVANSVKKSLGLKVKLYYNDYNLEWSQQKSDGALKLVQSVKNQGIQVDGVGLQAHLAVGSTPSTAQQVAILKKFTGIGLDVAYTELDIRMPVGSSVDKQKQQVIDYNNTVAACKQEAKCVGVTIWDFDDTYSWVPSTFSGQGMALPFYQPNGRNTGIVRKAAYDGIVNGWTGGATSSPATTRASSTTSKPTSTPVTPVKTKKASKKKHSRSRRHSSNKSLRA